jgi:hypothetical protein
MTSRPAGQSSGSVICQRLLQPTGRFRRRSLSWICQNIRMPANNERDYNGSMGPHDVWKR